MEEQCKEIVRRYRLAEAPEWFLTSITADKFSKVQGWRYLNNASWGPYIRFYVLKNDLSSFTSDTHNRFLAIFRKHYNYPVMLDYEVIEDIFKREKEKHKVYNRTRTKLMNKAISLVEEHLKGLDGELATLKHLKKQHESLLTMVNVAISNHDELKNKLSALLASLDKLSDNYKKLNT